MMMIIGIDLSEASVRFISGRHYNNFEHHPPNNSTQKLIRWDIARTTIIYQLCLVRATRE